MIAVVTLTTPGFGAGGFFCINLCDEDNCDDDSIEELLPITGSIGSGKRLGVSLSDDACTLCFNYGPSFGSPINVSVQIYGD